MKVFQRCQTIFGSCYQYQYIVVTIMQIFMTTQPKGCRAVTEGTPTPTQVGSPHPPGLPRGVAQGGLHHPGGVSI